MGSMQINFSEVESGFETMDEGRYPVVVEKVEVRESKSSDNNYLNWELTLTEGEHEGRKQWMITSLSPKALFRLKDIFVDLGVCGPEDEIDLEWDDDVEITPSAGPLVISPDLVGLTGLAIVTIDYDYDPKGRNKVDSLIALTDEPAANGAAKPAAAKATTGKKNTTQRRALR